MRIVCHPTPRGNVYLLYRSSERFHDELKRLVPFLVQSNVDMEVGPTDADHDVLLSVGPFDGDSEASFREQAKRHLA